MTDRDKPTNHPDFLPPTVAEFVRLIDLMQEAYATATGDHRAGLIAALNAALQAMDRPTTCPHRVAVLWTGASWVHVLSGDLATCDRMDREDGAESRVVPCPGKPCPIFGAGHWHEIMNRSGAHWVHPGPVPS